MRIFDKMFMLACFSYFVIVLVLSLLHFPFFLIASIAVPFVIQCIMLGDAWQREKNEANKVTDKKKFPPLPSDVQDGYDSWRND